MPIFYSPVGNPELWDVRPEEYLTQNEWDTLNPIPEPVPPTFDELKTAKKSEIASARYAAACGTLEIGGNLYHIDNDARTAFLGTLAAFQTGALTETVWKLADGTFITLSAEAFVSVATSVLAYIEQCFNREKALIALVDEAESAEELARIVW